VLLSSIITAGLALSISTSIIFQELRAKPSTIRRKLLQGYSDQQILVGIGLQSVGLAQMDTLIPYHMFIIWMLSLLSTAVHNATLLALVQTMRQNWILRWLRQALMFVNLALSSVIGVTILKAVSKGFTTKAIPIGCVWEVDGQGSDHYEAISYIGTVSVITGNAIIFALATWYLHSRRQRFYKTIQLVGVLLMAAIALGATIRVVILSQAFGRPSVAMADDGERSWSFGQLLSLLMLVLPVVGAVEIIVGEVKVTSCDESVFEGELQRLPCRPTNGGQFQPNPFFGSDTNLFKR
jgi:hypothetical protein